MRLLGLVHIRAARLDQPWAGAELATVRFFRELGAQGHQVTLRGCKLNQGETLLSAAWSISRYRRRDRMFITQNRLAWRLKSRRAAGYVRQLEAETDLVVLDNGLFAPYTRQSPRKPYVVYTDYTRLLSSRHPAYRPPQPWTNDHDRDMLLALERDLYQRAWHVFVQSEHTRASVISDYGVAPDRATAVMCGASVDIPTAPPARDWSSRRLLFVAEPRSFERKGGPTLVAAFAKVRAALPDATLTLVGPSPEQTGQQAGLTALGRIEDRARIAALYQAATCFALPTRQEPFGMVFTEAMAYRLPIVAARVDAVPELVQHERSGLVVEPDDPDALAAALIRVLSAPALAAQMGEAGYQHLQANLTWPRVVERVNRVLAQFEG